MNSGADAADQIVNMSLKGIEVMAKISGVGAKNLATYLYAVLKGQKKTKGKIRLEGLLRSGKELKVFAVRNEDLKKFCQEAKRYGVLYCALRDKNDTDGMCDIMVRAEDASKINRIVERFKLATVDTASIKNEIEKSRTARQKENTPHKEGPDEKHLPKKERPPKKARMIFCMNSWQSPTGRSRSRNNRTTQTPRRRRRRNPFRPSLLTSAAGKPPRVLLSRREDQSGKNCGKSRPLKRNRRNPGASLPKSSRRLQSRMPNPTGSNQNQKSQNRKRGKIYEQFRRSFPAGKRTACPPKRPAF